VVDDCTRECLALLADTSISGIRVARELDRLLDERGKPKTIVSDNGTELTSNAILQWARRSQGCLALHRAGQAGAERLCRILHRAPARRTAQRDPVPLARAHPSHAGSLACRYNHERPHSRLGWMSPTVYAAARRSAALRSTDGSAPRTAAITAQQGIADRQTPIAAG
jgi:putative transposase